MTPTKTITTQSIQLISDALIKKSKSTFKYHKKEVLKQAQHFTPAYREFIYKIISNNKLKIRHCYNGGSALSLHDYEVYTKLDRKQDIEVLIDINRPDTLPHELGHAIDMWFGLYNSLTRRVLIEDDKTLYDIFTSEFNEKHEELYNLVINEYKESINKVIDKNAYDIIMNNIEKYRLLCSIPVNKKDIEVTKRRNEIQKELYDASFIDTYYYLYNSGCNVAINYKYSSILDALSSKYNFDSLFLSHHKIEYYKMNKYLPVEEFFANMFRAKVTSKHVLYDYVIKYLPKSFNAFERLFVIVYDHIQNNKKFTDVKIKQEH